MAATIKNIKNEEVEPHYCWCGCGKPTAEWRDFIAGHQTRAADMLITMLYGGIRQFVETMGYGPNVDEGDDYSLETSYWEFARGKYQRKTRKPIRTRVAG